MDVPGIVNAVQQVGEEPDKKKAVHIGRSRQLVSPSARRPWFEIACSF